MTTRNDPPFDNYFNEVDRLLQECIGRETELTEMCLVDACQQEGTSPGDCAHRIIYRARVRELNDRFRRSFSGGESARAASPPVSPDDLRVLWTAGPRRAGV